jgi:hypothetical protein
MVNNGGPAGGWGRLIKSRCCPLSERHAIPKKGPKSVCDDRLCRPAALPRFRASSKSREMLAFAHIPTSTTANTGIDRDDWKSRTVAAGSQRADRDRSRSQTRRGYTLRGGSGCRTFGVHLRHYKLSSAAHLCVPSRFERAQPGDRRTIAGAHNSDNNQTLRSCCRRSVACGHRPIWIQDRRFPARKRGERLFSSVPNVMATSHRRGSQYLPAMGLSSRSLPPLPWYVTGQA